MPQHWKEWLGSLSVGHLENANFLIVVARPSATPDTLDHETLGIEKTLRAQWFGQLLHGVPDYRNGLVALGGVAANGAVSVRQVQRLDMAFRHRFGERPVIERAVLASARTVGDTLVGLHGNDAFRRVRLGFRACVRGLQEPVPEERLHQFVRAIDGLMKLPRNRGEREFINRGPSFVSGTRLPQVLAQLYRLRNAQEHLNDFRDALDNPEEAALRRIGSLRAYEAEQLALSSYRRLLSNAGLLDRFRDDAAVEAFWQQLAEDRLAVWGQPFDLDQAEQAHDRLMALIGFDD